MADVKPVKHPKPPSKSGDFGIFGKRPAARIMFKGVFDWDGLYHFIRKWFQDREYYFEEGTLKSKGDDFGKEEEYKWAGKRKITDYYQYKIKVEMHSWGIRPVDIIEKGKKKRMYKGKFILEFYADLVTDYQGMWKKSPFALNVKKFLDRFVWKNERMAVYVDKLWYTVYKFHGQVKEYLDMTSKGNAYAGKA